MSTWLALNFHNRNSPLIEHLIFFHDHSIIILSRITVLILYLIFVSMSSGFYSRFFSESQEVELFWTIIPTLILIFIALPSLKTLYIMEEIFYPIISLKIIGYQWYWGYEYVEINNLSYNSMIISSLRLFRLLETSNHLVIPFQLPIQLIVSSKDVIHSWTIPCLGIKVDAIPGRINQLLMVINRPGLIIGQCSEICGAGHRFMPITMESISLTYFKNIVFICGWNYKRWSLKPIIDYSFINY